ncbi:putative serine/threonine-protein kinase-like [Dorcoceras hygrometricum]|uniref:Putative serine/threonine-protein kinase-like n=1 Tax=Dorcoceras hygrometricum TaxID=472368 RepID=A0A2Z7AMS7_9LAMI|nr:putative serine/threonine-protein kinase-like [Dorcoceras hygrometricum]
MTIHRVFLGVTFLATRAWLRPVSQGNRHFTVGGGRLRQSGCFSGLPFWQLVPGSDQFRKETGTSRKSHSPKFSSSAQYIELSITDSACKNQLVVVSVQYGPFNPYIPIRSTTIGKSRVAKDPIAMRTSWRSNSDIASVTSIGYPCMSASGESSTMMHRLLHASGSHPIPTPYDPNFTRKPALQTVGGGRSSIRSTIGINLPPSICTRRSDGFCHGRNHLEKLIGTSSTTLWTAARRRSYGGGAAAVRWRRGGMGLNRPNGLGSYPGSYEHSVHLNHCGFIITPIDDQIGPIDSVSKTERVGEPWRIRIMPPGEAAEEQNLGRETINTIHKHANYEPFIGCFVDYLAGNSCLAPTSFARKPALHACTRRPDEISTDGFSSSSWPEQIPAREAAATAAAATAFERGEGGDHLELGLGFF